MLGGFGDSKPMDDNAKQLLEKHQSDVAQKLNTEVSSLEGVSYKTQVVAGTNYMIKAKVNGDKEVEVKIHVPLPHTGKSSELMETNEL